MPYELRSTSVRVGCHRRLNFGFVVLPKSAGHLPRCTAVRDVSCSLSLSIEVPLVIGLGNSSAFQRSSFHPRPESSVGS